MAIEFEYWALPAFVIACFGMFSILCDLWNRRWIVAIKERNQLALALIHCAPVVNLMADLAAHFEMSEGEDIRFVLTDENIRAIYNAKVATESIISGEPQHPIANFTPVEGATP